MKLTTKKLCILSILLALNVTLESLSIKIGNTLQIQFTFIITMFIASNFSLAECMVFTVVQDLLSWLIGGYVFNIGYTIQGVISMALYYLFLHKKQELLNISIVKLLVNMLMNVGLGSLLALLDTQLYREGYKGYLTIFKPGTFSKEIYTVIVLEKLYKNIILLPIEVIIFFVLNKYLSKFAKKYIN